MRFAPLNVCHRLLVPYLCKSEKAPSFGPIMAIIVTGPSTRQPARSAARGTRACAAARASGTRKASRRLVVHRNWSWTTGPPGPGPIVPGHKKPDAFSESNVVNLFGFRFSSIDGEGRLPHSRRPVGPLLAAPDGICAPGGRCRAQQIARTSGGDDVDAWRWRRDALHRCVLG